MGSPIKVDRQGCLSYQTRQAWGRTMGWPDLQEKALANSGMFPTTPLMRYSSGEWGLVMALARLLSGRSSPQVPLGKADEETLLGGEASDGLELFSGGGGFPGAVGEDQAAQIGDVLAEREFAVDLDLVNDGVLRILIGDAGGALDEFAGVLFGPPVLEVSFGVELAALVVEAVGEFVADSAAGVAVVGRVIHFGIEERRLEDAGGEVHVVGLRIVVGIDGGRGYVPFLAVHRFADFGELAAGFELDGAIDIAGEIAGLDA
jgi:hypothetical protein